MFVELHILQNFPPSNLNRDDVGQPKETDFGGVRRARVSSQCLKRSIRYAGKNAAEAGSQSIFEAGTGVPLSQRTKLMVSELGKRLSVLGHGEDESTTVATQFASAYAGKMDDKRKQETAVLLYLSEGELAWVTKQLHAQWDEAKKAATSAGAPDADKAPKAKKTRADKGDATLYASLVTDLIKETKDRTSAPDIALFGRMLADKPETNIDAACQIAHAISTHAVLKADIDYYTAMDEAKPRNDPGAAYLDVAYFNSACFYRYARIDVGQLTRNLGGDAELARKSVEAFIRASEAAVPSGKKNSHAQETRPSFVLAVVRESKSQGWSLVNAFEKPIQATTEEGLVQLSVAKLCEEFADHLERYGGRTVRARSVMASRAAKPGLTGALADAVAKPTDDEGTFEAMVREVNAALSGQS